MPLFYLPRSRLLRSTGFTLCAASVLIGGDSALGENFIDDTALQAWSLSGSLDAAAGKITSKGTDTTAAAIRHSLKQP